MNILNAIYNKPECVTKNHEHNMVVKTQQVDGLEISGAIYIYLDKQQTDQIEYCDYHNLSTVTDADKVNLLHLVFLDIALKLTQELCSSLEDYSNCEIIDIIQQYKNKIKKLKNDVYVSELFTSGISNYFGFVMYTTTEQLPGKKVKVETHVIFPNANMVTNILNYFKQNVRPTEEAITFSTKKKQFPTVH